MEWVPHDRQTWKFRYARLKKDVTGLRYLGRWGKVGNLEGPMMETIPLSAGTLVKIVMVSRFGDVGITERLEDEYGYIIRVELADLEEEKDIPCV